MLTCNLSPLTPVNALNKLLAKHKTCSLTIGTFDGVHLGHQAVLNHLNGVSIAITFINHPQSILSNCSPALLMHPAHRIHVLSHYVDAVYELEFTHELSQLSAHCFLSKLRKKIAFTDLVLGHDAILGHKKEGTPQVIQEICKQMSLSVSYLPPVAQNGEVVSSSLIRKTLSAGNLEKTASLLGRPYSIEGTVVTGAGKGKLIGFPTANITLHNLILPPHGVYAVQVFGKKAIANLGFAPTVHNNRPLTLEVHLLEENCQLYEKTIEVVFVQFLRSERKFSSIEKLKEQIKEDINRRLSMQK